MKKVLLYMATACALLGSMTNCSDFGDVNNDPEQMTPNVLDFRLVFFGVQSQACGSDYDVWRNGLIYTGNMMQHTTSVDEWIHGVFYTYRADFNSSYWDAIYSGDRGVIRDVTLVMDVWKEKDGYENEYQMCRVLRAYLFHRMTDLYGDIPYSEAAQGEKGILNPKYDPQQEIYNSLLKELDEAQAALTPGAPGPIGSHDLMYGGDVAKWKKFANSLMLRVAMRLTKVDPATAETWVKKAVANGLFASADDNAMVAHPDGTVTNDSAEPYGKVLSHEDPGKFFLSEYFINLLKETNDPRLPLIATVCEDPARKWGDGIDYGDTDPAKQIGLPIGYDLKGNGDYDFTNAPGYPGTDWRKHYSVTNRYTYARPDAPTMLLTYTENQLLLAEAAYRGWVTDKSAKDYYEAGVRAAMEQFSFYTPAKALYDTYLTGEAVDAYLKANPFDPAKALEQINTQYYITTFCDEYETFANWRRSGYPALKPVNKNHPNTVTNGTIPRRFTYPDSESSANKKHYQEAASRLKDGDKMTSRVWWDAE